MNQMAMYDELKCPEELSTVTSTETTTVEISSTTTEEVRPEVIIKNPQKMLEDVFNVETNIEVDSNRLDVVDAKKALDLMVGDQPVADNDEDKKILLKLPEKKEVFPKKSKINKKESKSKEAFTDDEPMMGDAPAVEGHDEATTIATKSDSSTTDRQRRDAEETTLSGSTEASSTQHSDATTTEESNSEQTTEAQQVTTVIVEETTTKNIVQGHPLFHNHAIFKEPISVDNNATLERKGSSNTEDHFIPPMLLVKARFTATKSTEGATEETKEMTTDISTSVVSESTSDGQTVTEDDKSATSKPTENNDISVNEISSITQLETTPSLTANGNERPIVIEKWNDPRLGFNAAITSTQIPTVTVQLSTTDEQSSSTAVESTTEESITSVSFESSISESSTTESQAETSGMSESSSSEPSSSTKSSDVSTSAQPEQTAERLIESTTEKVEETSAALTSVSVTPIASKLGQLTERKIPYASTLKPINKSSAQMRNEIDEGLHVVESHESTHESHGDSDEDHHHPENNLNNEDNYQPYKPNRHRAIPQSEHHGAGFAIGKILG